MTHDQEVKSASDPIPSQAPEASSTPEALRPVIHDPEDVEKLEEVSASDANDRLGIDGWEFGGLRRKETGEDVYVIVKRNPKRVKARDDKLAAMMKKAVKEALAEAPPVVVRNDATPPSWDSVRDGPYGIPRYHEGQYGAPIPPPSEFEILDFFIRLGFDPPRDPLNQRGWFRAGTPGAASATAFIQKYGRMTQGQNGQSWRIDIPDNGAVVVKPDGTVNWYRNDSGTQGRRQGSWRR